MLIEKLENKIKLALVVSISSIVGSIIIAIFVFWSAFGMIREERKKIYILDNNVPLTATHTSQEVNLPIEAKAHVQLFHQLFFTLPADDEYIKYTTEKAMYLIDESGLKQRNALQEKGFYAGILAQSASFSIKTDSIQFDQQNMSFIYYGTQRIERKTSILRRKLITGGNLRIVPRSTNNPHGLLITDYKTIRNEDVDYIPKSDI